MSDFLVIHGVINCSRINKARLFKKPDKPGSYLKIVLVQKKEKDQFGNTVFFIKEDSTKEERDAGVETNFIGDAKIYAPKPGPKPAEEKKEKAKAKGPGGLPF